MAAPEILRVEPGDDTTQFVVAALREACLAAPLFSAAPCVYVAATERRARAISRSVLEAYPQGTPERVARELIKHFAPAINFRGEVERDFDLFGALSAALSKRGPGRRAGRALVDQIIEANKRLAQVLPPDQRDGDWLDAIGPRGALLREVLQSWRARLAAENAADPEDALWLAADAINNADFAPGLVILEDIDRVQPARRALFQALLARAQRAIVILRGRADTLPHLDAPHGALQQLVLELGGRVLPTPELPEAPFSALANVLLQEVPGKQPPGLQLVRPVSRAAEVREVAREIKRAHAAGASLARMAVAMPGAERYRELINEAFAAAGIPFDAPFRIALHEVPPVAPLLDLLRVARSRLDRTGLIDALASPFLRFGAKTDGERLTLLTRLETATRAAWVVGGVDAQRDWLTKLDAAEDNLGRKGLKALKAWLGGVLDVLVPFTRARMKPVEFMAALDALLAASGAAHVVADDSANPPDAAVGVRAEALHAFERLVQDMSQEFERGGNAELPTGELLRALLEQCEARGIRPPEAAGERVHVFGLRELRGVRFDSVFVLGLTDQDLPIATAESMFFPASREGLIAGLLGDAHARELCAPIDATLQADYLYTHALLAADSRLVLSYPKDEGETPCVPATVHARLLRALSATPAAALGEDAPTSPHQLALQVAGQLCALERGAVQPAAELKLDAPRVIAGLSGRAVELARTDYVSAPGEYEGVVGAMPGLAARFGPHAGDERHTYSPSQLDTYAMCPQRFWSRYVMRVQQPDEPTLDTPPTAIGLLLHETFERFVKLLRVELGQPQVLEDVTARRPALLSELPDAKQRGLELIATAFDQACAATPSSGPFWDGVKRLVAAGLPGQEDAALGTGLLALFVDTELKRSEAGIGARFVEFAFGKGKVSTPETPDALPRELDFELPEGSMRLQGSVDRVDEGLAGLEIVDYKTGAAKSMSEIRDGQAFQLPTYLAAISRITGTAPHSMSYLLTPIDQPLKRQDVTLSHNKSAYDVARLVTELLPKRLLRIMRALEAGMFIHLPFKSPADACDWCEFRTACALRPKVIEERGREIASLLPHAYMPDTEAQPTKASE